MNFRSDLAKLVGGLDPAKHAVEIDKLTRCRRIEDLVWLAENNNGWLTDSPRDPRVKLVRHGTGTYLVVQYVDGWSSTLSQAPFRTR
ncbi:MAG: hypothetical protein R3F61_04080 [Myxococcota bacterium]